MIIYTTDGSNNIWILLNCIIDFNCSVFAVTTAVTTHDNRTNEAPHRACFATIIFGFKRDVIGFSCAVLTAITTYDNERGNENEREAQVGYGAAY